VSQAGQLAMRRVLAARDAHNNVVIVLVVLASTNIFIAISVTCNLLYSNIYGHQYIYCNTCDQQYIVLQYVQPINIFIAILVLQCLWLSIYLLRYLPPPIYCIAISPANNIFIAISAAINILYCNISSQPFSFLYIHIGK
jgi:hypothetical protein